MGRKKDWKELGKRGPGRKARKQQPPELPAHLREKDEAPLGVKKLGGRIKQRARRRAVREAVKAMETERKGEVKAAAKKGKKNKEKRKERVEEGNCFVNLPTN